MPCHTTVRQVAHGFDGIFLRPVDRVGRAEFFRRRQFVVENIDGDDRIGAEGPQELNRVEPHAATAHHQRGIARLDFRGVFDRVISRRHATADDARLIQRQTLGNFENHVARKGEILRKTADIPAIDFFAVGASQ